MNRSRRQAAKKNFRIEQAKQVLHPSSDINQLPCREKEYSDIFNFVKSSLLEQVGGCMFISGVPGTGKTGTVLQVMNNLLDDEDLRPMKSKIMMLEINGLKLTDPKQFYAHFYYKLFGKKPSAQKSIEELDEYFQNPNPKEPFIVLLVDELDQLCTKKQNILYHLFDWPNRPKARIVILSVANTMDLPERLMMGKIRSRLGLRRLQFQAYNHKELVQIVNYRLGDLKIFEENALSLLARKSSAIYGDARRVLDLCRRALDIAEQELGIGLDDQLIVTMAHASAACNDVFNTDKILAIPSCSEQEKIFLKSLVQEIRINGSDENHKIYFDSIYSHHRETCRFNKIYLPTISEFIEIGYFLYEKRLILIEQNKLNIQAQIGLNLSPEDVDNFLN